MAERPSSENAIESLRLSWLKQDPVSVEQLLRQHPELDDPDSVVDLIYAEILLVEESGKSAEETEYLRRFPTYQDQIRRQFQLHRLLVEEEPTSTLTGGGTLSPVSRDKPQSAPIELPGFDIQSVLGRGGSGIAYRAYDRQLKRTVAIKVLQAHLEVNDQLLREAEAAAALVHPSIVQVYQVGDKKGSPFLVMEFIEGESLAERLRGGPLSPKDAAELMVTIADAIGFAHQKSIIHRDLKPGNVLLDQAGQPHVCDFGLARKMDSEFTLHATGDVVGTPAYMAPEQARGESVSEAADVYSLGAILYHAVTGRPPFQAATPWEILNQVMVDDPLSLRRLNTAVPKDLETICLVALHKNPERRFESAHAFAEDLRRFLQGSPIQSRPVGFAERGWKLCLRNRALASMIVVSVLALATIAVVAMVSERRVSGALIESENALAEAETQRDVAFDAMKSLVNEVHEDLQKHEASVEARGEVLQSAIGGLQAIIDTGGSRDEILTTMVRARTQLAFILTQQGKNTEADQQYERAMAIGGDLQSLAGRTEHASTLCQFVTHCTRLARTEDSQKASQVALQVVEKLRVEAPDSGRLRSIHALSLSNQGRALIAAEEHEEGIQFLQDARSLSAENFASNPEDQKARRMQADIDVELAGIYLQQGKTGDAILVIEEARKLIAADDFDLSEDNQLYRSYLRSCRLAAVARYRRQEFDTSRILLDEVLEGWQRLAEVEPNRPGFRLQIGVVSQDLTRWCMARDLLDEAELHVRRQLKAFAEGMKLGGQEYRVQGYAICQAYGSLSEIQFRKDRTEDSRESILLAAEALEPLVEEFDSHALYDALLYRAELISGLMEKPSKASEHDVQLVGEVLGLWRSTLDDDFSGFDEAMPRLTQAAVAHPDPFVQYGCLVNLAASYGQKYRAAAAAGAADEEAEQTLKAVRKFLEAGVPLDDILASPDFKAFRESQAFRNAFVNQG